MRIIHPKLPFSRKLPEEIRSYESMEPMCTSHLKSWENRVTHTWNRMEYREDSGVLRTQISISSIADDFYTV